MNIDLIAIIWAADKILMAVIAVLAAAVIIDTLLRKERQARRDSYEKRMKIFLHVLADLDKESVRQACADMVKQTSAEDFVSFARLKGDIIPDRLAGEFKACFSSSQKIRDLERQARPKMNKWVRIRALLAIGAVQSQGALAILTEALADPDNDIAYYAMLSLADLKSSEAGQALIEAFSGRRISGQKIASLLQSFPDTAVVGKLSGALRSQNTDVRFWAVRLLSVFKDTRSIAEVRALAADSSADVRAAVCLFLGQLKDPLARDILIARLTDPQWFVRMQACRALFAIEGTGSYQFVAPLLADDSWLVQEEVKKVLRINPHEALPYIVLALERRSAPFDDCFEILENSGLIQQSLRDITSTDAQAKEWAVRLIRLIKDAGGAKALDRLIDWERRHT